MASLILNRATIGLSNMYQDHYLRPQAINVDGTDLNNMLAHRLGNTTKVAPSEMRDIAARSGGVSTQTQGLANIEDGWATSRGLGSLEFVLEGASPLQAQTLTVYGYMYNGSPADCGQDLPMDIMFIPVKSWIVETTMTTDAGGFPQEARMVRQSGKFLLNDNTMMQGLNTIRPTDVINSAAALSVFDEPNQPAGALDGFGGATSGLLQVCGMNITKSDNDSQAEYAHKILTSAATASFEREICGDRYGAICSATGDTTIKEVSLDDNPFIRVMRAQLGHVSMANFAGFSIGEIASVFDNFRQVTNVQLTDTSAFKVDDHRYTSDGMAGADFESIVLAEINNLGNYVMNRYRLSHISIRGSNNVPDGSGQLIINGLPVAYQLGQSGPTVDKDPDWQWNAPAACEELLASLYAKYNATLLHERMIVDFNAELSIFGDSNIMVSLHGDMNKTRSQVFGTMAGNRFDPNLVTREGMGQSVQGFFNNLKDYMNF